LSCNIFITNVPAYFSSKDLWNTCSKFGTVLDVYIPNKVSKQGSFHLYANVARFNRGKVYMVRAKEVTGWVPDFWEENSEESEDYSDNNSVGKKNRVESEEVEIIPEYVQNDAFIDNIAESEPINGDSRENQSAHEMNDSNPKFPSGFTPQHSDHYEYEKVEALRESTTPQNSKMVRNDQSFHQVLKESVNKSSGVSKTAQTDSMAGLVKQRNGFSILERFQEFIDIGQAMGYKMKGAWGSEEKAVGKETLSFESENGLPDDLTKCANLFRDLKDIDHKDSIDLAQKANSKFFHGIVNKKRRHLAIKGILVDGEWIENLNRIKSEFHSYYSNLFSAPAWDRSLFDVNFPRRLNSDQVFDLEDMVSNEEIKRAVWDCGSDKSPEPDGFTFEFLRNFGLLLVVT
nr:RNA-directed DNA polymerase, eukaryota [Tanacetum cinerariifolium]